MPIRAARFMFTSPGKYPARIALPTHGTPQESEGKRSLQFGYSARQWRAQNGNCSPALDANLTTRKTRETRHSLYVCHTMAKKPPIRVHNLLILRNKHQNIWMTKCYH